jgi:hypothetical protein
LFQTEGDGVRHKPRIEVDNLTALSETFVAAGIENLKAKDFGKDNAKKLNF